MPTTYNCRQYLIDNPPAEPEDPAFYPDCPTATPTLTSTPTVTPTLTVSPTHTPTSSPSPTPTSATPTPTPTFALVACPSTSYCGTSCPSTYTLTVTLSGSCSYLNKSGATMTRTPGTCDWFTSDNMWWLYCSSQRWYLQAVGLVAVECMDGTGSCPPASSGSCVLPGYSDCAGQTLSWVIS